MEAAGGSDASQMVTAVGRRAGRLGRGRRAAASRVGPAHSVPQTALRQTPDTTERGAAGKRARGRGRSDKRRGVARGRRGRNLAASTDVDEPIQHVAGDLGVDDDEEEVILFSHLSPVVSDEDEGPQIQDRSLVTRDHNAEESVTLIGGKMGRHSSTDSQPIDTSEAHHWSKLETSVAGESALVNSVNEEDRLQCRFFASGHCRKGEKCPFLHVIEEDNQVFSDQEFAEAVDDDNGRSHFDVDGDVDIDNVNSGDQRNDEDEEVATEMYSGEDDEPYEIQEDEEENAPMVNDNQNDDREAEAEEEDIGSQCLYCSDYRDDDCANASCSYCCAESGRAKCYADGHDDQKRDSHNTWGNDDNWDDDGGTLDVDPRWCVTCGNNASKNCSNNACKRCCGEFGIECVLPKHGGAENQFEDYDDDPLSTVSDGKLATCSYCTNVAGKRCDYWCCKSCCRQRTEGEPCSQHG
eukprot:m.134996 g.134996  ORF g.134996 m.134996 type:complete len:466 (-) comp13893_c0_seq6:70-1467(-)